jgi:hypothetical protein
MILTSSLTLGQCRANDQNFHRQSFGIVDKLMALGDHFSHLLFSCRRRALCVDKTRSWSR